ncbi:hypothetical protein FSP39_007942 [Pinctada imbricata]|uniref:RING-type domain-containing protein n=1 Tax=Pinctada imbricata TaxID=66713 RepID=A0AA89C8L8_PINIB|nr:hypothetical protein FSP39_007942 [Pinctada imbricata]
MSDNCSICQDVYEEPKFLNCGHTFCCKCLDVLSESSRQIKCPLCRQHTTCPKRGAEGLMDNFLVRNRQISERTETSYRTKTCIECLNTTETMKCEGCSQSFCENCMFFHTRQDEVMEDVNQGIERELQMQNNQTAFYFKLDRKISISKRNQAQFMNGTTINQIVIESFGDDKVITALTGENSLVIYNNNGDIIKQHYLNTNILGIASGLESQLIIISYQSNAVLGYSSGTMNRLFSTQSFFPEAVACLNNGRIALVGYVVITKNSGNQIPIAAALQIFDYYGNLVTNTHLVDKNGPLTICVKRKSNDIYIGDRSNKEIMLFLEDGSYVSSYNRTKINLGNPVASELVNKETQFPFTLAYYEQTDLLLASYISPVCDQNRQLFSGIYILSPTLQLLGHFYSDEKLGLPTGVSCNDQGKLWVGDGAERIIRVFKLSRYMNKLIDTEDLYIEDLDSRQSWDSYV